MSVTAQIQFVQGATVGTPGVALYGTTGALVTASNVDNSNVRVWTWTVIDSPPTSALVPGIVTSGAVQTLAWTPDQPGGYLIQLDTQDLAGNKASTQLCFGVKNASGRFVPSFKGTDTSLNFLGGKRGWASIMEAWFAQIEAGASSGASLRQYPAIDGTTFATWGFDKFADGTNIPLGSLNFGATTIPNLGSGGAAGFNTAFSNASGGAQIQPSVVGQGLDMGGNNPSVGSAGGISTPASTVEPPGASFSVELFVRLRTYGRNNAMFFSKQYRPATYVAPFLSIGITALPASGVGAWQFVIATAATLRSLVFTAPGRGATMQLNQDLHIVGTYDGATMKAYLNGVLCGTNVIAGTVDYGTHGAYNLMGNSNNTDDTVDGVMNRVIVSNVPLTQTQIVSRYKAYAGLV